MFATAMEDDTSFAMLMATKADPALKNFIGMTAADIKKSREVKEELPAPPASAVQTFKPSTLTPAQLISNSPHMSPFTNFISPPTFFVLTPEQAAIHQIRKSSNAVTPSPNFFIASPHLTPIGAMSFMPQVFFPPDFPTNVAAGANVFSNSFNNSYDFLNARINMSYFNQSGMFFSPSYNQGTGFISPCV